MPKPHVQIFGRNPWKQECILRAGYRALPPLIAHLSGLSYCRSLIDQ